MAEASRRYDGHPQKRYLEVRDAFGRGLFKAGSVLMRAGGVLCGWAGSLDADTDHLALRHRDGPLRG